MKTKKLFSPSTNIIRDNENEIKYITTENSKNVFNSIISNYFVGFRSFYIVGNYGTGKSSFLWAFEKTINDKINFFDYNSKIFAHVKEFEVALSIGDYSSFINHIAGIVGLNDFENIKPIDILNLLKNKLLLLKKQNKGLIFIVDEYGKFLEYASRNNPSAEVYFIQQFSELINDSRYNAIFISTLHQDFNSYAYELTKSQRDEWNKVKGRLYEIPFNENIEHLLLLASERIKDKSFNINVSDKDIAYLSKSISDLKAFSLDNISDINNIRKLLPLDNLAAATLTFALQKYGQSERSLFTFLESNDKYTIDNYDKDLNPLYNLNCVYDYLNYHFYSFLASKNNPDYTQWSAIKMSLERAEGIFGDKINPVSKIIKTIGLLNIFALKSVKINRDFLKHYAEISLGVENPLDIIQLLEQRKIIRYLDFASKFILFEGTDLDIEFAINEASKKIDKITNVVPYLNKYFSYEIPAKSHFYKTGTPRFFKFVLSNEPYSDTIIENDYDGIINIVFSDNIKKTAIEEISKKCNQAILFGLFSNTEDVKNIIFEINKILKVREENRDDRIAIKELELLLNYQKQNLNSLILDSIYNSNNSGINWYFKGEKVNQKILTRKSFNQLLSEICDTIYPKTVKYKNEMVNRTKLSSPINSAKRIYFIHLFENYNDKDLAFPDDAFPPQKTIYLSLLKNTEIHFNSKEGYIFQEPTDNSFKVLWDECENFLNSSKSGLKPLSDLYKILYNAPFRLKKGFLDFWIPTYLFIKRADYALYQNDAFISDFTTEIIEILNKNHNTFKIKAFNLDGVRQDLFNKYRVLIGKFEEEKISKKGFIDIIKPFLVFYKQLNDYTKNTKRISKTAISFREVIINATDPEKVFFEDFPLALGFDLQKLREDSNLLEMFINNIRDSINELRTCFDELNNRILSKITTELYYKEIPFLEFRKELLKRYKNIKEYLLLPYQKSFLTRIKSEIKDKNKWLSSITYSILNKYLENITDFEEEVIIDKLISVFKELDNLCEFTTLDIDSNKEEVARIELQILGESNKKYIIRYPKSKDNEISKIYNLIKNQLNMNTDETKAAIMKLINNNFTNDKN